MSHMSTHETEMSSLEAAKATSGPVLRTGSAFMLHRETLEEAGRHGYSNPFWFYFAGRGGVLGDCDADVVASAFAFFEPGFVRSMWEPAVEVHGAREAAHLYAQSIADWGRRHLQSLDGGEKAAERFAELAGKLVTTADPAGMPLFAGWRAEPLPQDPLGKAMLVLQVMREWRGALHIIAVVSQGMTPLEAVLLNEAGGEMQAQFFGWKPPFPDCSDKMQQRARVEDATDEMCARVFEQALSPAERGELGHLAELIEQAATKTNS